MFDTLSNDELAGWVPRLAALERDLGDRDRVERLRLLEQVSCAVAAAQARDSVDLDIARRAQQADAGIPARRRGDGVAAEIGLARRVSPHKAASLLGLAKVLHTEMPHTLALMTDGALTEWRATLLARETACLSIEHRATIDATLCADANATTLSDRELVAAARRLAATLDAAAVAKRASRAATDRHVTIRPAPDTMTWVTALLPVADGVAVWAALTTAADSARAAGDDRSRGQVMADTLVQRVTGRAVTDPVDLHVNLILTDTTLLGADDEPAVIPGHGPVPAAWARERITTALAHAQVWVRRLYLTPTDGELVAMTSRARLAPTGLAELIALRDQSCRTPWCAAPIRHTDHIVPHADGGPTTADNLQGLCERCNHARQAPGWHAWPAPGPRHTVHITTPAQHRYHSTAPPPPGTPTTGSVSGSHVERRLQRLLAAA